MKQDKIPWLDRVIGWISPQAEYNRMVWRMASDAVRSYDAGNHSRLNANWTPFNAAAEQEDRYNRDTIRARSRDLERNSDVAGAIISAYRRNVVGRGFSLQAKTGDTELNDRIEVLWNEWCRQRNCDVTGMQSFTQILRMCVQRKKVDGGILLLKRFTGEGLLPFQLQTVEVDELDVSQTKAQTKGNLVVGGVEYTPSHRPAGYHLRQYDINGYQLEKNVFIPAKDAIFYFSKRRSSQTREISDFAQTITRIRDANAFLEAVSVKERIAACLSIFIKRSVPSSGFGRGGAAPERESYEGKTLAPGMIKELNVGDDIQVVDPKNAAADAAALLKLQQRMIGAGQGLSYEAASRDMSETNYSSARQGLIEDGLTYAEEIELLQETVMDEVYETFLISAVLAGKLDIPDFWQEKRKYMAHYWVAAPKPWIDPVKEANANRIALQSGQMTFQQIAAAGGRDWKQQIDDTAEVLAYGREKGIELGGVLFGKDIDQLYPQQRGEQSEEP